MAAQRGSLVAAASVLLAVVALTHPAACSPFTDILAAVETVTTSFEVANSSLAAAGGGATELAAAAGLGVRGEVLKAARSTKRCSHTQPTAEEYAVAAPALAAAELFEAEEDAAYQSSRRSYFFLSFLNFTFLPPRLVCCFCCGHQLLWPRSQSISSLVSVCSSCTAGV